MASLKMGTLLRALSSVANKLRDHGQDTQLLRGIYPSTSNPDEMLVAKIVQAWMTRVRDAIMVFCVIAVAKRVKMYSYGSALATRVELISILNAK